jgi:hypothetical protein
MHRANLTIITIPILLLAATVAISSTISEDAFARDGRYSGDSASQAAAVSNDCLNSILDSNTIDNLVGIGNCGGTISQQHESGQASALLTFQTANPTLELQRSTTSAQPGIGVGDPQADCEACFQPVVDNELQGGFLDALHSLDQNFANANTNEEVCMVLLGQNMNQLQTSINNIEGALDTLNLNGETIDGIVDCLKKVFGIP